MLTNDNSTSKTICYYFNSWSEPALQQYYNNTGKWCKAERSLCAYSLQCKCGVGGADVGAVHNDPITWSASPSLLALLCLHWHQFPGQINWHFRGEKNLGISKDINIINSLRGALRALSSWFRKGHLIIHCQLTLVLKAQALFPGKLCTSLNKCANAVGGAGDLYQ